MKRLTPIEKADYEQRREYVLRELRVARTRARLLINEIDAIGVALKWRMIDPAEAIEWLALANGLEFLKANDPPATSMENEHERPTQPEQPAEPAPEQERASESDGFY